jgi:queuine/archaeosine tRNA-ribosyltransferase
VQRLVAEARQAIKENSFERYRKRWRRLVAGKGF